MIPGNIPALDGWLDSSRNSLYFHVSPVGTFPLVSPPNQGHPALPPALTGQPQKLRMFSSCCDENRSGKARRGGKHQEPYLSPKPLPTGRKLIFLETYEQMRDGSNLSCNKFVFLSSLLFSLWKSMPIFWFSFFLIFTVLYRNLGGHRPLEKVTFSSDGFEMKLQKLELHVS